MARRSYRQYCGLARALEIVGERWSLLIVRELLVGPARYGELLAGLPGIATNLLAQRLRELETAGVVQRRLATNGNAVTYALTPWGSELRGVVAGLVNWSAPLMVPGPGEDSFQPHWLVVALESLMQGRKARRSTTVGVEVDNTILTVQVDKRTTHVAIAGDRQPDTVFRAEPSVVLGLAAGMLTIEQATALGELRGNKADLQAVFDRR